MTDVVGEALTGKIMTARASTARNEDMNMALSKMAFAEAKYFGLQSAIFSMADLEPFRCVVV